MTSQLEWYMCCNIGADDAQGGCRSVGYVAESIQCMRYSKLGDRIISITVLEFYANATNMMKAVVKK